MSQEQRAADIESDSIALREFVEKVRDWLQVADSLETAPSLKSARRFLRKSREVLDGISE